MSFYERMGITPLINASETYTNLGGSLICLLYTSHCVCCDEYRLQYLDDDFLL